jgi:hypothetical protein
LVEWGDECVWILLNLKIINGTSSLKSLPLEAFTDRVYNEGFQNGFEDFLIPFHGHKMATCLVTSVDKSSCKKIKEGVSKKIRRSNHKATTERLSRNYVLVDVMQSRIMCDLRGGGSFSLPPLQGVLPLMSRVFFVTRLKRTSSTAMSIPIESSSATG